jgi:ABC-2 type transport system permease protein
VPAALLLLLRVNVLQAWRRLKSLREQSRLLVSLITGFIAGYAVLAYWIFYKGMKFLNAFPGLGTVLEERLLYLLFAILFVLLLLSNLVISYTNLFRNREAAFLLGMPVPAQTVFRWKFIESTLLASWAFLFLIAPLLAAYGVTHKVAWHFYPVTVVLIALFIVLPGVVGAWAAINLARYLDRRTFQIAALGAALLLVASATSWWKAQPITEDNLGTRVLPVLDQLLIRTRFAQYPFLPSYWLSSGVLQWADGALGAANFFALVLFSYVGFFGLLAFTRFGNVFYDAVSVVQSRAGAWGRWEWFRSRSSRKAFAYAEGPAEKVAALLRWVRLDTRALVVKDARTFWRDTTQWGQSVLLFGLLGVYIINLRHFTQRLDNPFWVGLISCLNLAACSLNLATVTTRFVYPQFSLEGRGLWIIGLAPMGLERVVKVKYWLASGASLVVTLGLMTLSCLLLNMTWDRVAFFGAVVTVMTFTLNGLATGLGVLYPNFKENNPSKIVSGFGGTFCLVLSFFYILGSILLVAASLHGLFLRAPSQRLVLLCVGGFALLSFILGWLPMKLGLRQLGKFEL